MTDVGVIHLVREQVNQAGHLHVHIACADVALRLDHGTSMPAVASGFYSAVTCPACRETPAPWRPWKHNKYGLVVDLGQIVPV